ncbi:MAG TPA: hypothetical protein VFC99_07740 [Acidimicrobiia bacterium]|nr:hypothetical protein [Acidimicrobiia bacterium]
MRRRALVLLVAALAAGALTLEATATTAGASVNGKSHHSVVEKKKKKKKKAKCDEAAIRNAYDYFLNGTKGYTPQQKEAYIQFMDTNAAFKAQFEASAAANAAAAATTSIQINSITCAKNGKSAQVAYDLVLNGQVAKGLVTAPGGAILDHGKWKVTAETVCNLQALGDPNVLASGPCADIINGTAK